MKVTITDLRYRMKDVLSAVERGEPVTVLNRGKPKAKLVPFSEKRKGAKISDDPAFGMWKDREDMRDPSAYVRKIRQGRVFDL
jgi:prevent-host-death family protein